MHEGSDEVAERAGRQRPMDPAIYRSASMVSSPALYQTQLACCARAIDWWARLQTRADAMSRPQGRAQIALLVFQRCALARILATVLAIAVPGSADLRAERLPLQSYNASTGLAHDRIHCVVPDSRGFLWFCTADGLSRFDGSRFVNYGPQQGLPHPSVEEFVEVGPGTYWVATVGGLARLRSDIAPSRQVKAIELDTANAPGHHTVTPPLTAYLLGPDVASNHVFTLEKDRAGWLWIGTAGGLFVLERPDDEPSFRRVEPDPSNSSSPLGQVRALAEGPDRTLWIGTLSGLFRRLPDGQIVRDPTMRAAKAVRALLADRFGRIWVGHDSGLSVFVPMPSSTSAETPHSLPAATSVCNAGGSSPLPTARGEACRFETLARLPAVVRSLSEGSDGRVWIGTPGGLVEFDGERFRAYTGASGLINGTINAVAEDGAGNVWIGADAGGVSKLPRHGFVTFRQEDGLRHDYVTSISQSRAGRVRVQGGWPVLNEFDGERFTSYNFNVLGPSERAADYHYDIVEDHTGDLWVGTPRGLFRFPEVHNIAHVDRPQRKTIYTIANGLPADRVAPAFEDSRGDVWMTVHLEVDRRVMRWQRSTGVFHQYPETDLRLVSFGSLSFAEDSAGTVWFGSSRGLARHRNGRFTHVGMGEAAMPLQVTGLHVDARGRLWVGTRGAGLYRSDDPTAERPRFTAYTVGPQGLSSGTVWCMTDDGARYLYVGTAQGVDRLEPDSGQFTHFSVADGLAGSEVITAFRDRAGALWFGTFTGISRLTPRLDVAREPPTVWIGGLRIRGVAYQLSHLGQPHVSIRDLEPHENQVQIDYFGLDPATGEPLRYQYRLEGTDSPWTAPTLDRSVNYAELAAGSYRVLVRAVNTYGHASEPPASVTFTILLPVWKRWWFLATLALLMIASGYAVHRYRVTRLLEIERLRTRIASDLHDDLGSSLSQIAILSEVVRTHLGSPGAHIADPLSRIGTLSRESVDSMSDIVWAIDPLRDSPIHLLQRMRRVATELLRAGGPQLRFEATGDPRRRLTADVRRHVFLIFKEILNNIIRHADATAVSVEVTVTSRQLQLSVTDDGRGFDTAGPREGQGLRNMHRRASSLGGSLEVTSSPGAGTRVTFTLPLR